MARFRPNIVVTADRAWAEDSWRQLRVCSGGSDGSAEGSALTLWGVKRCSRCKVTTVDQTTGIPHPSILHPEPLTTLRSFRGDARLSGEVYFGLNVVHEWGDTRQHALHVGDRIQLLDVGPVPPT